MTTSTTERAREAAGTAADEGKHVADVARQQADEVVTEAKDQIQHLLGQAMDQVSEQSTQQRDRLVETLQSLSSDLKTMASQGGVSGLAADLSREVADRCRALGSRIEGREPQEILDDVRSFARQRPGTFLLGALAAGVVAGRLARGAKAAASTAAPQSTTDNGPASGLSAQSQDGPRASAGAPDPLASPSTPGQRTQESHEAVRGGAGGSAS